MTIRPATPLDVPAVLPMVAQICAMHELFDPLKYGFLPNPAEKYERWLGQLAADPRGVFLVAEREAEGAISAALIGFLAATLERDLVIYRVREHGFIHDIWVEPAYRNEGVARQMLMLAMERFRQMGIIQLRLDTAASNDAARKLFESCGFRVSAMEMLADLAQLRASEVSEENK